MFCFSLQLLVTTNDSRIRLYNLKDHTLSCKYKGCINTSSQIKATFRWEHSVIIVNVCTTSLCLCLSVSCAVEMASISSVAQRTTLCTCGRPILTSLSSLLLGGTRMNITSASQVSKLYNYCTIGLLQYVAAVVVHFQWFSGSKLYQMCAFTSTKYVIIMMHGVII